MQANRPKDTQQSEMPDKTKILVVEDEPSLRLLVRKVLERSGFEVLEAASGVDRARVSALAQGLDTAQLGRMLFELAAAAQSRGLDPEGALRQHSDRLMRHVEGQAQQAPAHA